MKNTNLGCARRVLRVHHSIALLLAIVFIFYLLWTNVDVDLYRSEKDTPNKTKSFADAYFRKRPAIIITKNKLQNEHLATAVENAMRDRLEVVQRKCKEGWKPQNETYFKKMNTFYFDARRKLGYCHVAKAGCTFWLRIFTYLTRRTELKYFGIHSPFTIERVHLHSGSLSPRTASYWRQFEDWVFSLSFRFFITRNPYARLLSVYLDKYYLLGYAQIQFVPGITCDHPDRMNFQHFFDFALNSTDHHLLPISDLCNPCEFQPHAIGKMETFKSDAQFILDKANYGSVLRNYNHTFRIGIELNTIAGENFDYLADIQARYGEDCLTAKTLSMRLWKVFQYNGYIPSNLSLPDDGISFTKHGFLSYIKKIVQDNPLDEDQSKRQRDQYLFEFYSNIDKQIIDQIKTRYSGDFELFGYSTEAPTNISL